MLNPHFLPHVLFVFPILNVLIALYQVFLFIHLPGALGLAIITLTIIIRLLVSPFLKAQQEMTKKMQDVKPHMDKLNEKHKGDAKRLQEEQMKLYKEHGVNPAAGCLPAIVQIFVFWALYRSLFTLFNPQFKVSEIISQINDIAIYKPFLAFLKVTTIDPSFFGLNLALTPAKSGLWYYYLIPVITALLQYFQTQAMTANMNQPQTAIVKKGKDDKKDTKDTAGDFQKAMNVQMKYILPVLIGYFSFTFPVGLALYWNVFSIFSIIQYRKMNQK